MYIYIALLLLIAGWGFMILFSLIFSSIRMIRVRLGQIEPLPDQTARILVRFVLGVILIISFVLINNNAGHVSHWMMNSLPPVPVDTVILFVICGWGLAPFVYRRLVRIAHGRLIKNTSVMFRA
jgi:hypothetical protein